MRLPEYWRKAGWGDFCRPKGADDFELRRAMNNFFAELKRRNVYKVAVAYAVVGWLLIQVATQVFPFFEIPNWGVRLIVAADRSRIPYRLGYCLGL